MNKKFYISTPIYYPSANFHIGHCYTTIIADAIARYKRLSGFDVYFQTGTDEHGQKIESKARDAGVTPKEYVDKIINDAKNLWDSLGITYDYFIRTTDSDHVERVQKIFLKLYENGDIYKGDYSGLYCTPCESFWTESQLVDGMCPDCAREVHEVKEEAYFFRISKYADRLMSYYDENPNFLLPISRKNEMINNFIKPGLQDLCVSRTSFSWGIPVTFDNKHVIYVWIDALSNYITSLGYPDDKEKFDRYWPCDLHLVGKEIVRFHAIIWPCILMALDLPLPKQVFGHGWLIVNGGKISKSLGNYKDPREYIESYGVDAVRYFALREVPFGSDGNFSEESLVSRMNSDLANTLGNLVNRSISMAKKYFNGKVCLSNSYDDIDIELLNMISSLKDNVDNAMNSYDVGLALSCIFDVLRRSNKYVDETMPWILYKNGDLQRLEQVIFNLLYSVKVCAVLLQPYIPTTCDKIFRQLGIAKCDFSNLYVKNDFLVDEPFVLFERK